MSTEFEREELYIVFKLSDLGNSLKGDEIRRLAREYAEQRRLRGKPPLECAVVESDWPEYEPTWRAIEARVAGERLAPSMPSPDIYVSDTGRAWDAKLNPELRHSPNATPYWAQPSPSFADAYQGAMEDVAIWKKRTLEAEDLNRKFVAEINGPAYMGEPAQPEPSVPTGFVWPECPKRRQSHVLFDDGYEEGWAKCVATMKEMLAAAPEGNP